MKITSLIPFQRLLQDYGTIKTMHQLYIIAGGDNISIHAFRKRIQTRGVGVMVIKNVPHGGARYKYPEYDGSVTYSTYAWRRKRGATHEQAIQPSNRKPIENNK